MQGSSTYKIRNSGEVIKFTDIFEIAIAYSTYPKSFRKKYRMRTAENTQDKIYQLLSNIQDYPLVFIDNQTVVSILVYFFLDYSHHANSS